MSVYHLHRTLHEALLSFIKCKTNLKIEWNWITWVVLVDTLASELKIFLFLKMRKESANFEWWSWGASDDLSISMASIPVRMCALVKLMSSLTTFQLLIVQDAELIKTEKLLFLLLKFSLNYFEHIQFSYIEICTNL